MKFGTLGEAFFIIGIEESLSFACDLLKFRGWYLMKKCRIRVISVRTVKFNIHFFCVGLVLL